MVMIQVGVVIEVRAVKMVQGSIILDQEADRLKVSRCHSAIREPKELQQYSVDFNYPTRIDRYSLRSY